MLEHEAAVRLNRPVQHFAMGGQRQPHPIGVGLPPTGRTLDIGEEKRHHPRGSSRPISGSFEARSADSAFLQLMPVPWGGAYGRAFDRPGCRLQSVDSAVGESDESDEPGGEASAGSRHPGPGF